MLTLQKDLFKQMAVVADVDTDGNANYSSLRFSQHELGAVPAGNGPHSPGMFWTFVIAPPNKLGELTSNQTFARIESLGFFINFANNFSVTNRRRGAGDTSSTIYLEMNAVRGVFFDANAAPITTVVVTAANTTTAPPVTITKSSTNSFSNDVALIVGICGGLVLLLLIIAVLYTRKNLSAASSKITSLKTRKFVRVMAPAKAVWDPANMGDWWTVSPTGEKPFHFFPSLWDPDNVEDWWTMSEMSSDPLENMGYKNNPNFLDGPDAAASGNFASFDPYAEYGGAPDTLEGFWSSN
jgi:hypothetical protein